MCESDFGPAIAARMGVFAGSFDRNELGGEPLLPYTTVDTRWKGV